MSPQKDYYKLLGVEKGASLDEIKKSFRKQARKCHPDLNPGDKKAEERFKSLNDAYAIMSDSKKRQEYDTYGTVGGGAFASAQGRGGGFPGGGGGGFPGGGGGSPFEFDFGDVFSDILGQGTRGAQATYKKGSDIIAAVEVTLKEAFTGVTRRMSFKREALCSRCGATGVEESAICGTCHGTGKMQAVKGFFRVAQPCPTCSGTGRKAVRICTACTGNGKTFSTETLNVKIPAGVDTGSTVKLRGMGNAGLGGAQSGDLRLRVTVSKHSFFVREGKEIQIKIPITFGEAVLGAKVDVPTIDGSAKMTLPPGTQGGQRFKLKGKGFTGPRGGRGDMLVTVTIAVPTDLNEEQKAATALIEEAYSQNPRTGFKDN